MLAPLALRAFFAAFVAAVAGATPASSLPEEGVTATVGEAPTQTTMVPGTCSPAVADAANTEGLDLECLSASPQSSALLQQHRHMEAAAARTWSHTLAAEQEAKGNVYLVGNGPISEEDHKTLETVPPWWIFRFNGMVNLRSNEPVGRVFVRNTATGYWGLGCCVNTKHGRAKRKKGAGKRGFAKSRVAARKSRKGQGTSQGCSLHHGGRSRVCWRLVEAREVILLGGDEAKQQLHEDRCAGTFAKGKFKMGLSDRFAVYAEMNMTPGHLFPNSWSSGFLGLAHLRGRFPKATIHVMGMNWMSGRRGPHPFQIEERLFRTDPSVTIHATPTGQYHRREVCSRNVTSLLQDGDSLAM